MPYQCSISHRLERQWTSRRHKRPTRGRSCMHRQPHMGLSLEKIRQKRKTKTKIDKKEKRRQKQTQKKKKRKPTKRSQDNTGSGAACDTSHASMEFMRFPLAAWLPRTRNQVAETIITFKTQTSGTRYRGSRRVSYPSFPRRGEKFRYIPTERVPRRRSALSNVRLLAGRASHLL